MIPVSPGSGSGVAAFFDMDNTVLSESSGRLYLKYLRQTGSFPVWRWAVIMRYAAAYALGRCDFPHLMSRLIIYVSDENEAATWELSERWYRDMLSHYVAPGARDRIAWHREQGHHVAIVSAATTYAVRMVAEDLGCGDAFLATRLEVIDGRFTGAVIEPACYGIGKVTLTLSYAAKRDIDLSRSFFYSDSHSDLPLLEAVGHPVAVNPNRKLARIARRRSWPVERFY